MSAFKRPAVYIAGLAWCTFLTSVTQGAQYEWTFASGNLSPALGNGVMNYADAATPGLTSFGTTDGATVPHVGGQAAHYLRVPAFTDAANGYRLNFAGTSPNGGGSYLNQYTFVFDFLVPNDLNWTPFFNSNPDNGNDADFYIDPSGAVGIGALGYAPAGSVAPDTWYRLAFAADLAAGEVKYYLNGVEIHSGASGLDGRFALYSDQDAGDDVLLFNEGDGSGVYTHELLVSSVFFSDRTMTAAELLALGGPNAFGVVVPEPGVMSLAGLALLLGAVHFGRRRSTSQASE